MRAGTIIPSVLIGIVVSGCGAQHAALPPAVTTSPAASARAATRTATVVLRVPRAVYPATARRVRYVPANVRSARFTTSPGNATTDVSLVPGSATCPLASDNVSYVCTVSLAIPTTTTSVLMTAYDQALASGSVPTTAQVLARGTVAVTASADQANVTLPLTLGGVPASADATVSAVLPSAGTTAASVTATLAVRDAAGSAIVGAGGTVSSAGAALTFQLTVPGALSDVTLSVPARSVGPASSITVVPGDVITVSVAGGGIGRTGVMLTLTQNDGTTTSRLGFVRIPADTSTLGAATVDNAGFATFSAAAGIPPDIAVGSGATGEGVVVAVNTQLYRIAFNSSGTQTATNFCTAPNASSLNDVAFGPTAGGLAYQRTDGHSIVATLSLGSVNSGGSSCAQTDRADTTSLFGSPYTFANLAADGTNLYATATFSGTNASEFVQTISQAGVTGSAVADSNGSNPKPGFTSIAAWNGKAVWVGTASATIDRSGVGGLVKTSLTAPAALAQDDNGTAYVLDGGAITKCDVHTAVMVCTPSWATGFSGVISGPKPMAVGADGALWIGTSSSLLQVDPVTKAMVMHYLPYTPQLIVASGDGRVYAVGGGRVMGFP